MAHVFLDCDSTVTTIEGIDELARLAGCAEQVAALTSDAMDGSLDLPEVFARRLALVKPDKGMLAQVAQQYIDNIVAGAAEAVGQLGQAGHVVWIVSAGLSQAVLPLATRLGLPASRVHSVDVRLDDAGGYRGFDEANVLIQPDGKAQVCRQLCGADAAGVMVGDGINDAAVVEQGITFIQFAGIADRAGLSDNAAARLAEPSLAALPGLVAGLV